jgi:hypothetical protein
MLATLTQYLSGLAHEGARIAIRPILRAIADRQSSQTLVSPALAISIAGSPLVKTTAAAYVVANGKTVLVAAGTALAGIVGTVGNAMFNVVCFYVDSTGVTSSLLGTPASSLAGVGFPTPPEGKAMLGFVIINPTVGTFTGGTTALDSTSANAVYVNTVGAVDPSILL